MSIKVHLLKGAVGAGVVIFLVLMGLRWGYNYYSSCTNLRTDTLGMAQSIRPNLNSDDLNYLDKYTEGIKGRYVLSPAHIEACSNLQRWCVYKAYEQAKAVYDEYQIHQFPGNLPSISNSIFEQDTFRLSEIINTVFASNKTPENVMEMISELPALLKRLGPTTLKMRDYLKRMSERKAPASGYGGKTIDDVMRDADMPPDHDDE